MRRVPAVLAAVMFGIGLFSVQAATPPPANAICGTLFIYEDVSVDGDHLNFCAASPSIPNLGNVPFNLAGDCHATMKVGDNWNNCLDSARWFAPAGFCFRVYKDASYSGTILFSRNFTSPENSFINSFSQVDQATSIKIGHLDQHSVCVQQ